MKKTRRAQQETLGIIRDRCVGGVSCKINSHCFEKEQNRPGKSLQHLHSAATRPCLMVEYSLLMSVLAVLGGTGCLTIREPHARATTL